MIEDVATTPRRKLSDRERLAVWERCRGVCQGPCGRKLAPGDKWEADHPRALGLGGSDDPKLFVVLCDWCHPQKTRDDMRRITKAKRSKIKHIGAKRKSGFRGYRRFNGDIVWKGNTP